MLQTSAVRLSATVQRLALKHNQTIGSIVLLFAGLWSLFFFSACTSAPSADADRLNDLSYASHYRSLDSVRIYADSVLELSHDGTDEYFEALNNLAFYHTALMEYDRADSLLNIIYGSSRNHIELMIASVQQMRLCQRRSDNKNFYEHRQRAVTHHQRIYEEVSGNNTPLTERQLGRLLYAETEFQIVSSAYFFYVGLIREASAAINDIDATHLEQQDPALYLAYLYNLGSGGIITQGSQMEIAQQELDLLMQCYVKAGQYNMPFWQANALQAISEHLAQEPLGRELMKGNAWIVNYLNTDGVSEELLAGNLAEKTLHIFTTYGDVYQTAAAWRSLADAYFGIGDYPGAVYCLQHALDSSPHVAAAPSLIASIHEKMSIAFSALDDKQQSDLHRNAYLDLQENTRQDRQLEARADQLQQSLRNINIMILGIVILIILLLAVLLWLIIRRRRNGKAGNNSTVESYRQQHLQAMQALEEQEEENNEHRAMATLELEKQQETYEEHRAKMWLIDSLTPLIDRMLHEVECLQQRDEDMPTRTSRHNYILELTKQINDTNDRLTDWIKLKQGDISMRIETFNIADIFDIVEKGATAFRRQGITLTTDAGDLSAKADRTLTLFMVNTLCDNARKFTPAGGTVMLKAENVGEEMIEISVTDDGAGMSPTQLATLFDPKAIRDESTSSITPSLGGDGGGFTLNTETSHGFGLLNCKGIIEKYKKTSPLFSSCTINAESTEGKGTRIAFRLPRGIRRTLMVISLIASHLLTFTPSYLLLPVTCYLLPLTSSAATSSAQEIGSLPLGEVRRGSLIDSLYQSNIHGDYHKAMYYAHECIRNINEQYRSLKPASADTLYLYDSISATPSEVKWLADSLPMPYDVILSLRNETAVAALALHDFTLYEYNNNAGQQLFREMSVDKALSDYCSQMQQMETDRNVAIVLLVILVLAFIPLYYFLYYRHVINDTRKAIHDMNKEQEAREEQLQQQQHDLQQLDTTVGKLHVANNVMANSLSTIKHETMYFPSRIRQIVMHSDNDDNQLHDITTYYRSLYGILSAQAREACSELLDVRVLTDILERKLARLAGIRRSELTWESLDGGYRRITITITRDDATLLAIVTQAVRDLGELTALRRCGTTLQRGSSHTPDTHDAPDTHDTLTVIAPR